MLTLSHPDTTWLTAALFLLLGDPGGATRSRATFRLSAAERRFAGSPLAVAAADSTTSYHCHHGNHYDYRVCCRHNFWSHHYAGICAGANYDRSQHDTTSRNYHVFYNDVYSSHRVLHHDTDNVHNVHHGTNIYHNIHHGTNIYHSVHHGANIYHNAPHGTNIYYSVHHGTNIYHNVHHGTNIYDNAHHGTNIYHSPHHDIKLILTAVDAS
ncbi:histidine-rich glycoprotein-like [Pollicipes pollicipes]|uniref:histidine-rich glycoprotein-like n=1 Tax=Pollicipes pollicipes TaxID=41117 RepID=UPI00188534C1|nr:histidine-rich glycoprotein-like [Pollicipes pollicipes]